jgi:N-acetylmuramoyl-L-alanine amidase
MRTIKKIILHCSDSDDSLDFGLKDINEWHKLRGFMSPSGIPCGYHFIVRRDGNVEIGRPVTEIGAHCKGHNSDSIGICWIGRKAPSPKQSESFLKLIRRLMDQYKIPVDKVFGHKEFEPNKTCPNLDMNWVRAELIFTKG